MTTLEERAGREGNWRNQMMVDAIRQILGKRPLYDTKPRRSHAPHQHWAPEQLADGTAVMRRMAHWKGSLGDY